MYKPFKVLFILTGSYPPEFTGGIESSIHETCTQLRLRGAEVAVLARFRKWSSRARRHAVRRILRLDGAVPADTALGYPTFRTGDPLARLPEVCRRFRPDVAVIQRGRMGRLSCALLRRGVPVVASLHNAVFDESNDFYPYDDRLTYIANSDFTAAMFQKHTGMRAEVLYPLVQPDWYHVDPVGEFVTFVNPTPVKGLDIALALAERRPDIPFQFVESWPLRRPALRSLKTQLQRLGNVTLLPRTEDMRSVYGRSRLILMPTRIDEAWGRVVTEAQVSGIPAIAADRGGLPESVGSGGILVDPAGPISAWVDALGRLWDEPEAYAAACDAARTHAERPAIQVDTLMGRFMAILAKQAATA